MLRQMIQLTRYIGYYFLAAVILTGCSSVTKKEETKENSQAVATMPQSTPVFSLTKGRLSSSLQIPGELIAYQQVDIYAKENSFVKKLFVDVGSEVKTGQLLVTMALNSKARW